MITLQISTWSVLISGLLESGRMSKSYCGAEINNIYERLCLYFYPVGSLADKRNSTYIYKLFQIILDLV